MRVTSSQATLTSRQLRHERRQVAVVSGLGPNGFLAALTLLRAGFIVQVAEKRGTPTRPIHLGLRASYLERVRTLAPEAYRELLRCLCPVDTHTRALPPSRGSGKTTKLLDEPVVAITRLDDMERIMRAHIDRCARRGDAIGVVHGELRVVRDRPERSHSARVFAADGREQAFFAEPALIVLAEGGRSTNAAKLGLTSDAFSSVKRYLSAHTARAIGPLQLCVPGTCTPDSLLAGASACIGKSWITGHRDPSKGTWLVAEVPTSTGVAAADLWATLGATLPAHMVAAGDDDAAIDSDFTGAFAFQQQMRSSFCAGDNVVVFGDAGGMGHHAYSSGTAMGLRDAEALSDLARALRRGDDRSAALARYDSALERSRLELMAYGMSEYDATSGPETLRAVQAERRARQRARLSAAVDKERATSGCAQLDGIIDELGRRVTDGEACAIVVDIDGTLVDTRERILGALHVYGRTDVRLSDLDRAAMEPDEIARAFGLDLERFRPIWESVFWQYDGLAQDRTLSEVASRVARARELGVQAILATGRRKSLEDVTRRDLAARGITYDALHCKPRGKTTLGFKEDLVRDLAGQGVTIGAYVGDTPAEVAAVARAASARGIVVASQARADAPTLVVGLPRSSPRTPRSHTPPVSNALALKSWLGVNDVPRLRAVERLGADAQVVQYGAEVEYEPAQAEALLRAYRPARGVDSETWDAWSHARRWEWVMSCVPTPWEGTITLPMVRHRVPDGLDFLPETLALDGDGNLEIILSKVDALEEIERRALAIEAAFGEGSWQGMVSAPRAAFFGTASDERSRACFDGFLTFYSLHDTFKRLAVGADIVRRMPTAEVARPFMHAFLGPMTAGKQRFLRDYLEANRVGERMSPKWLSLVRRAWSSFKYVGGTAYRPDVAGPERPALEVRDCKHVPLLVERMTRATFRILEGFEAFAPFASVDTFDSERDYARLSAPVRRMLEQVIPSTEKPELASMYSRYDAVALQVYRNFALPVKDYGDLARALGGSTYAREVRKASSDYVATLEALAAQHALGEVDDDSARQGAQAALAHFAERSGLAERLERWDRRHLAKDPTHAAQLAMQLDGSGPLARAFPADLSPAPLDDRLRGLVDRWPDHVRFRGQTLYISTAELDTTTRQRLADDYARSVANGTMSVRASADGELDVRLGIETFAANRPSSEPRAYTPAPGHDELVLPLSVMETMRARAHLARHAPAPWVSGGIPGPSWVRHIVVGERKQTLEARCGLEPRHVGESPLALVRALEQTNGAFRVCWTEAPLDPSPTAAAQRPRETRSAHAPLTARVRELSKRWPDHVRLVASVRFGGHEGERDVLFVSRKGLTPAELDMLTRDYVAALAPDTISFPLSEGAYHLRARIGDRTYSFAREGMRAAPYAAPSRLRLETLIKLSPQEMQRMRDYAAAATADTLAVIGPHTAYDGPSDARGSLTDNRPPDGERHNCTTWATMAPIGDHGERLHVLAGMPDGWSRDNAGWLSLFLSTRAPVERSPLAVFWTDEELTTAVQRRELQWSFNPL